MQVDILTEFILPFSLFLIMLGMGLSLRLSDFKQVFKQPKAVLIGLSGQLLLLPAVAFVVASLFALPAQLAVGLMIVALAPGGATSNMFSYLFKGDVALSISLTAIIGLIAPFSIPILVALSMDYFMGAKESIELPILETILKLLVITVVPVAIGMFTLSNWANVAIKAERFLKVFSVLFMFVIIGMIFWKNLAQMTQIFTDVGLATLTLNLTTLALGFYIAKWSKLTTEQSVTIGFEVGIQSAALAMVVAGTLLNNTVMMVPAVAYGLLMFVTGSLFGWLVTHINNRKVLAYQIN